MTSPSVSSAKFTGSIGTCTESNLTMTQIEVLKSTISSVENDTRVRKYILKHYRHIIKSKEKLHQAFIRGEICVNNQVVEETRILHEGDVVEIKYDESVEEANKLKVIPIDILYDDPFLALYEQNFVIFEKALRFNMLSNKRTVKHNLWCINEIMKAASGLVLVAKTEEMRDTLRTLYKEDKVQITMRVIVQGSVSDSNVTQLFHSHISKERDESEKIVPTHIVKGINIVSVTPSNHAHYISTLDLTLHTPIASSQLRQLFCFYSHHPIIGNSTYTKPLVVNKDKGLYTALTAISFIHPVLHTTVSISVDEPSKFKSMRDREAKFHERKLTRENDEIEKAGGLPIDLDERKNGEPLAYMLGQKEFCNLVFKVTKDCLIPRTSSETLVKAALNRINKQAGMKIIDVGTGCGNLLISIIHSAPNTKGVGIDISDSALMVAKENEDNILKSNKIEWRCQNMADLDDHEPYDIMVCNPPYLDIESTQKKKEQMAVLEKEPQVALFAKEDGYEWYNVLHRVASRIIKDDGRVILECGKGMMDRVETIWAGWEKVEIYKDAQDWDRCLVLKKKNKGNMAI